MMKGAIICVALSLACLAVITESAEQGCVSAIANSCSLSRDQSILHDVRAKCVSVYSGAGNAVNGLQNYVFQHISHSFKYLLLSSVFSSYEKNREGFQKLYKKLSDDTWEDAIEIIQYITKRGFKMNLNSTAEEVLKHKSDVNLDYDINEIQSLSVALDLHKKLAESAHRIHGTVTKQNCHARGQITEDDCSHHDPEVASYIEQEFVHQHAKTVRTLSGHINDLFDMSHKDDTEPQLELYLFDQYLKKTV